MSAQEVASFFLVPFLDFTEETLGQEGKQAFLDRIDISEQELRDKTTWVSLRQCEAACGALVELHGSDDLFVQRAGLALQRRYMGPLRPILRAFGNPKFAYEKMIESLPRFNKVGHFEILENEPGHLKVAYTSTVEEQVPWIHRARTGQMAAFPTLFDLPPATVEVLESFENGDGRCIYDIRYRMPAPQRLKWVLGLVGLGLGAGAAALAGLGLWFVFLGAGLVGLLGYIAGISVDLRAELAARSHNLIKHNDALREAAAGNERRFAELQEAKADVDLKVEQRTAELSQTRDELAETLSQVQSLSETQSRFFANLSHDLRTPLTLIMGPMDDLARGFEPPGGRERALLQMRRNGMRLQQLIDQILLLARMDAGAVKMVKRRADPVLLGRATLQHFVAKAERDGIALHFQKPEEPIGTVAFDRRWVESALTNLVDNALRVASDSVSVKVWADAELLHFEVEDDGPGLSAVARARIFERFEQGRHEGSAGLGLAIVSEVAALHDGHAAVDSGEGIGSRFRIALPLNAEEDPHEDSEAPAPMVLELDAATTLGHTSADDDAPLALVVDDEAELREHIAGILAPHCRVVQASNGSEALETALRLRPDIIVTDLMMPVMDGLALTRAVRADAGIAATPIILLTAFHGQEHVLNAFHAGATDYLGKPFHVRELIARVHAHLRVRNLLRELTHAERLASMGRLAASLAHQLRNPLNALLSAVQLLPKRLPEDRHERVDRMLGVMQESSRRIHSLTEDLLDLSGVQKGEHAPFRPAQPLEAALRLFEAQIPPRVSFERDIVDDAEVVGRAGDFAQVQVALIENAVRAVGDEGDIRIRSGSSQGEYLFSVEDTGPGVDPDVEDRIFAPFFTTRGAGEGTGWDSASPSASCRSTEATSRSGAPASGALASRSVCH